VIVLLDAGPLGLVTNPNTKDENVVQATQWLMSLLDNSISVCVPEISYYEVRRELVRAGKTKGLKRLEQLIKAQNIRYLPITTEIIIKASELWATSRQSGRITAPDTALDGDVILSATALSLPIIENTVIATTNTKHLAWFTNAKEWLEVTADYCLEESRKVSLSVEVK